MIRSRQRWAERLFVLVMGSGLATLGGCFSLPADDVTFTCDFDRDGACPEGYACEADGCCHRDGSNVDAKYGECRLGGTGGTGVMDATGTGPGDTDTDTGPGGTGTGTGG